MSRGAWMRVRDTAYEVVFYATMLMCLSWGVLLCLIFLNGVWTLFAPRPPWMWGLMGGSLVAGFGALCLLLVGFFAANYADDQVFRRLR